MEGEKLKKQIVFGDKINATPWISYVPLIINNTIKNKNGLFLSVWDDNGYPDSNYTIFYPLPKE